MKRTAAESLSEEEAAAMDSGGDEEENITNESVMVEN